MKYPVLGAGILLIICIVLVSPAGAFTAKNLDIAIQENRDATIIFSYELSWFENAAVFSKIADPGTELARALKNQFNKDVTIIAVSGNQAQFRIEDFAYESRKDGGRYLVTPSLSFRNAEQALKKYWFAPLISPDFSPEVTRVSFPDGYTAVFNNQDQIPSVRHLSG